MVNTDQALTILQNLKTMDVGLEIDDFGTGYSSLSYLHRFPIDTLKIDRSFVGKLQRTGESAEMVQAIVSLAHNLGMDVIAEGVETAEQHAQLTNLDCEYGQGFLFSKPLDSRTAEALLTNLPQRKANLASLLASPGEVATIP
jgi:EAL domain-containing protein (putative c-di-GMP-specific phosphodiesterase class I)